MAFIRERLRHCAIALSCRRRKLDRNIVQSTATLCTVAWRTQLIRGISDKRFQSHQTGRPAVAPNFFYHAFETLMHLGPFCYFAIFDYFCCNCTQYCHFCFVLLRFIYTLFKLQHISSVSALNEILLLTNSVDLTLQKLSCKIINIYVGI